MYLLDPYRLPLYGQRLIEASAGTGKTYTIGLLYLRLLLGLGKKNAFFRPLTVKEILVVTFTDAATDKLRERIRHNIYQMRMVCIKKEIDFCADQMYLNLLSFIQDRDAAAQLLMTAELQMDDAAIYTIHSFCYRILVQNSHSLKSDIIIKDEHILQKQTCYDFWRRNCYPLDYCSAKVIMGEWSHPDELLSEIKPYLQGDLPIFIKQSIFSNSNGEKIESIKHRHESIIHNIKIVKNLWLLNLNNIYDIMTNIEVNKRSYSKYNLSKWIKNITKWAQSVTIDYKIPKELFRFSQAKLKLILIDSNINIDKDNKYKVFIAIDNLLNQPRTLRDIIIYKAITEIRQMIINEKKRRREIGFDDLVSFLDQKLHSDSGEDLANFIRASYPVVMVDECQDLDPKQDRILQRIYQNYSDCGILLIGDPKQAIYSFRGANIFTYIKAKQRIRSQYTLDTNWRSSSSIVIAINEFFSRIKNPFLFEQISFNKVKLSPIKDNFGFVHKLEKLAALNLHFIESESISLLNYQKTMADQCASQIFDWLKEAENGSSWLYKNNVKKPINANDITVLVRSHQEAKIIRDALSKFNISSVFLSNRESVFASNEARDLLFILQAVLYPDKDSILRCALATRLIGLSAHDIENFNRDENHWEIRIEEFTNYFFIWQKYGVLSALQAIMNNFNIAENLILNNIDGERRLIDVMHLIELLKETELKLNGNKHALIRWLARQIDKPNNLLDNDTHQISLEINKNIVQINTIHKSKGLEYPIVWLPFAYFSSEQKSKSVIFHDRNNLQTYLDLIPHKESIKLANEERLSEDIRLLYVAMTRAVYHCSIGIAAVGNDTTKIVNKNNDIINSVILYRSALDYLLQNEHSESIENENNSNNLSLMYSNLVSLVSENISLTMVKDICISSSFLDPNQDQKYQLLALKFTGQIQQNWRITSYSELINHEYSKLDKNNLDTNHNEDYYLQESEIDIQTLSTSMIDTEGEIDLPQPQQQIDNFYEDKLEILKKDIHAFPRGKAAGKFLHSLLEVLPSNQDLEEQWLIDKLEKSGFSINWAPMLKLWLFNIFTTPLPLPLIGNNISLSNINNDYKLMEMEFYLPIEKLLHPSSLDKLTHQYDTLSQFCSPLSFEPVMGVLKGYIDLVFSWQHKFYLIDYKSNWLGGTLLSYNQAAIKQSMMEHRYDLQYQLYTLAIHRYLRNCLPNYDYNHHFGGVIYFFLRGIDFNNPNSGIFHTIPTYDLINNLDRLFSTEDKIIKYD